MFRKNQKNSQGNSAFFQQLYYLKLDLIPGVLLLIFQNILHYLFCRTVLSHCFWYIQASKTCLTSVWNPTKPSTKNLDIAVSLNFGHDFLIWNVKTRRYSPINMKYVTAFVMNLTSFGQGVRNFKIFFPQQDLVANLLIPPFIYLKSKTSFQEFILGGIRFDKKCGS